MKSPFEDIVHFDSIRDPYQHISLFYNDHDGLEDALAGYFDAGLKRGDLCVFGLFNLRDSMWDKLKDSIADFDWHVDKGDFVHFPVKQFYVDARGQDLSPYEREKKSILAKLGSNRLRLVGDVAGTLWQNGHFDAWIQLEKWWQGRPFGKASSVCPYPASAFLSGGYHHDYTGRLEELHDMLARC